MPMRFVAIDVETANADMASICSIGAAIFDEGHLASEWQSLVNPDDYFDPIHVSIHGIDQNKVSCVGRWFRMHRPEPKELRHD
jgi:DNA polymerase III subunit epsilon